MIKRSALALAFTTLLTANINTAEAAAITVEATLSNLPYGSESFSFNVNGQSSNSSAGQLLFDVSKITGTSPLALGSTFLSFCVEFSQAVNFGTKVQFSLGSANSLFGAAKANAITRLFTGFGGQVNSTSTSAAFQLALWEIVDDFDSTDWNSLQLNSGKFRVSSNTATANLAQSWLGQLSSITSQYQMYVLSSGVAQNQLIFTGQPLPQPAPVTDKVSAPATLGVFGLGLVLLGLRRRKA